MKKVYVIVNTTKDPEMTFVTEVILWLHQQEVDVYVDTHLHDEYDLCDSCIMEEEALDTIDFAIVLGGDGTIIHSALRLAQKGVPILGINIGSLGFLTQIEQREWKDSLSKVLEGKYEIQNRMMLEARVYNNVEGVTSPRSFALNDVVMSRMALSRMVGFNLYVNDELVNNYSADGIIIATPTGSTAYNLSAGGPVLAPDSETMVSTPICPHSLTSRSLVLSSDDVIRINFEPNRHLWANDLMLTVDGKEGIQLNSDSEIVIKKSDLKTRLLVLEGHNFYKSLRRKLGAQ